MALFPKIQSPCPYKNDLSAIMDGDMCRMCKRQVVDITQMSDAQRVALIGGCKDEICVSYRLPTVAAAALAAAAILAPVGAAACDVTPSGGGMEIGGIKDTKHVEYVQVDPHDKATPELPVVYDDKDAAPAKPAKEAP
jgi:predicted Fe-S protein YdhL (DUF1289 family)